MKRLAMAILWPSFLVAIAEEGAFFSIFDPDELLPAFGHLELPPMAFYTVGFFGFWLFTAMAGWMAVYLARPGDAGHTLS